jgi:hypothetical protein
MGDVLVELGAPAEAIAYLQEAVTLQQELGRQALVMESLATLARAHLAQGDTAQALASVETILAYLAEGGSLDSADQPLRNYLTCYRVLRAADDPRNTEVLQIAYTTLQERAALIPDEETRRSFLENVPWHREIMEEMERRDKEEAIAPVQSAPVEAAAPELSIVAKAQPQPETETELVKAVKIQPAIDMPPVAEVHPAEKAAPTGPEGETVEESPVRPAIAATAQQVAKAIEAGIPGVTLIVYGDLHIHFHDSSQDTVRTKKTKKRKKKKDDAT